MCIGIPGKISQLTDSMLAKVVIGGVIRDIDLTLVGKYDEKGNSRLGQWVLIHVGFAMSVLDEQEALATLAALQNMYAVEPDVGVLLYGEEKG